MITDTDHLSKVAAEIVLWLSQAVNGWQDEDDASAMPKSGDGTGSQGPSNPVAALVTAGRRTDTRDRLAQHVLAAHRALRAAHLELTPRTPTRRCRCCQTEMATVAPDADGVWTACPACHRYRKTMGYRCDQEVHDGRPQVRMCQCPDRCCDVCPDRISENRSELSDRCAQRKARGIWDREQQTA